MAGKQSIGTQTSCLLRCGLGCATVVFVALGLGFLGTRFARQTTRGFETAIETRKDLEQQFGPAESYVPAADGTVAPARMEAFLAVREASASVRDRLAEASYTPATNAFELGRSRKRGSSALPPIELPRREGGTT